MSNLYRMTYVRPLGKHIPLDAEALEAYERDMRELDARVEKWGCWLWALVSVLAAMELVRELAEIGWRP